ncbi:hypothetical protein RB195_015036 [Necator americanus]|uniref:Uncharacterized protein n=1 Tax=Necator americanus TaxID=51031 RepID=A0ABR1E2U6_NECAM
MPHSHHYKRRGTTRGRSSHCHSHELLEGTFDSPVAPTCEPLHEHLWLDEAGNEKDFGGFRFCPVYSSTHSIHSIWRPVRQPSRESRSIFENESRPPCPIHKRPASVGSRSSHTAILDDDVVVVEPEPEPHCQPVHESASRHSAHSKRSKRSRSHSILNQRSLNEDKQPEEGLTPLSQNNSKCSVHSKASRSSSSYSTGISLSSVQDYDYNGRAVSLYRILKDFSDKYPRLSLFLAILVLVYFFINQVDLTIAHMFESFTFENGHQNRRGYGGILLRLCTNLVSTI